jgi:acyl-ACP thioesterase
MTALDPGIPLPASGRTYTARRRVRLADLDPRGRVRLDALARFLQDVAIEDVEETGWGLPEHLWFLRSIRIDVLAPFVGDREVELTTWSSGRAAIAAARRWSVRGDAGGRAEVDSVWIHVGRDGRPARIDEFAPYAEAAGDRRISTRLELPLPPLEAPGRPWPLRLTDVDLHGHVNNAVYWQAVEEAFSAPDVPLRAELDFHDPLDAGDALELVRAGELLGFRVGGGFRAVARVAAL